MLPGSGLTRTTMGDDNNQRDYGGIRYGAIDFYEKGYPPVETHEPKRWQKMNSRNWMSFLDDNVLMSAITIPGTHDSAAYTRSWPFVATQKMSVIQQLDSGIRYFDFRCALRNDAVEMVHGVTYLGLTLEEMLNAIYKWIEKHSSEALVIQIKKDRKRKESEVDFANAISQVLSKRSERWRTANTTPTIGALRGRIQLFRRFVGPELDHYGVDVSVWQDNPSNPFTICTLSGVKLTIQDHYAFPDPTPLPDVIARKGGDVSGMLKRADSDPDAGHWYLNFTSAFEINFLYQIQPREIAVGGYYFFRWNHGINIRLRQSLQDTPGQKRFGIVAMDFPEQGADNLIEALFMTNFNNREVRSRRPWFSVLVALVLLKLMITFWIYKNFSR